METIRSTICEVLQARMPHRDIRIQLIPIEWHKYIHQITDPCMNNISLDTVPGMRLISNDYIMDALYYLSKDRQQSIINHVTRTFNGAYHEFMDAHPTFQGNIGIFGYSLGGLITWDILSHQRPLNTLEEINQRDKLGINVPQLDFKPQFLFGVGCPLGAFLNIRNQDPKLYHPDESTIFENIYHPCDPLAYRVEPLYHPDCRHHPSIKMEPAISNTTTPVLSSLTDWVTSWFKKSTNDNENDHHMDEDVDEDTMASATTIEQDSINNNTICDMQQEYQHPYTLTHSPSTSTYTDDIITDDLLSSPSTSKITDNNDEDEDKNEEESSDPTDKTTLLSSMGAFFQYMSPRASFDQDSALGSDNEDNDDTTNTTMMMEEKKNKLIMSNDNSNNVISPPPTPCSPTTTSFENISIPIQDPNILYRRRQSQIYVPPPSSHYHQNDWTTKKLRRQSLPNHLHQKSSSFPLLHLLPNGKRIDYALQPDPMFGGIVSNHYLLGLQAHFSYWNNKDMLWHMVHQLDNAQSSS
ncbi:DDHD domain-containing protein [Cunninghamella echinulata]|nr:DDHD domain-containing protein [Cunninghamella echinulata]